MKKMTKIASIGLISLLSACNTFSPYASTGSVADANGADLRLCFGSRTAPPVGQEVEIMRRESVGSSHPPFTYAERKVVSARIMAAPAGGSCVAAELINGNAWRLDSVRSSDSDERR